jgi:hypothetical protein
MIFQQVVYTSFLMAAAVGDANIRYKADQTVKGSFYSPRKSRWLCLLLASGDLLAIFELK